MSILTLLSHLPSTLQNAGVVWLLPCVIAIYFVGLAIYRLRFHPLAKFPGPRLAALSFGVEFYWDVIQPGRYTWAIKQMHERYGPIVRISPDELHIDDPDFYTQLYTSAAANPRDKWPRTAFLFANPTSHFATISNELHRARRSPFNAHFSRKSVIELSSVIVSHVDRLCRRISNTQGSAEPINLKYAYAAFSLDVITEYAFGKPHGALLADDYHCIMVDSLEDGAALCYVNTFFPWLRELLFNMPPWLVRITNPKMQSLLDFQAGLEKQIKHVVANPESSKGTFGRSTIFHEMITSNSMPQSDRNMLHYLHEGHAIVGAGQLTTACHLMMTTYHLLANPDILKTLQDALRAAIPDPSKLPPLAELENIEYLSAVVTEGHRVSYGVPHRLSRVSAKTPIVYKDWEIPPKTAVGMSIMFVHDNPEIFPNPQKFDPGRFMGPEGQARKKYVTPFSKGSRSCLGQNLAQAELHFTIAAIFRRFENLELYETSFSDIEVVHDYFIPLTDRSSKGVRVLVK